MICTRWLDLYIDVRRPRRATLCGCVIIKTPLFVILGCRDWWSMLMFVADTLHIIFFFLLIYFACVHF